MNENNSEIVFGGKLFFMVVSVIKDTEIVNKKLEFSFMYFSIVLGLMAVLLNISVLILIWTKEKTTVNQLMMIDCIANIMVASLSMFHKSLYFSGIEVEVYCHVHMILANISININRLCPVAIAVFR